MFSNATLNLRTKRGKHSPNGSQSARFQLMYKGLNAPELKRRENREHTELSTTVTVEVIVPLANTNGTYNVISGNNWLRSQIQPLQLRRQEYL